MKTCETCVEFSRGCSGHVNAKDCPFYFSIRLPITITIRGGAVQSIANVTEDVIVEVRNYDIDGAGDDIWTEDDGTCYRRMVVTSDDCNSGGG